MTVTPVILSNFNDTKEEPWQLATINQTSWVLYRPFGRNGGLRSFAELPKISCPLIDYSKCDQDAGQKLIKKHIHLDGVDDLQALIDEFTALGAVVLYPVLY